MKLKATVLCENYVLWHRDALGEHGYSVFLETDFGNWLWDTGNSKTILHNAAALGLDLKTVKGIALSHNHWDHTGGLLPVLEAAKGAEVFAHPALFRKTYHKGDEEREPLGIPYTRGELEAAGASLHFSAEFREIAPGFWLTGEVPRVTEFENGGMRQMIRTADGDKEDNVSDDQSAVIETEKGLVVVLGCCHSGLVNTLTYISEKLGTRRFHAVFGGTHLAPVCVENRAKVLQALGGFDIARIGISHCSGLEIAAPLARIYEDRFSYFGVGAVLEA